MEEILKHALKKREEDGLTRELVAARPLPGGRIEINGREYVNLSSNDYLSLSFHEDLATRSSSVKNTASSTCSSRLMTGSTPSHQALEKRIAILKGKEAALIFNSGYQANLGVLSALFGKNDAVFSDKLNHASIIDGVALSGAALKRFHHNDPEHLEYLLRRERGACRNALIVTETVFSMDGDIAPIRTLARLKKKYNCALMADEAHATGVYGKNGAGLAVGDDADIVMGTFGKALAGFGAYVASSKAVRDFLVNFSRSFIYSTSLPEEIIELDLLALDVAEKETSRRVELLANAAFLREELKKMGFDVPGESQIIPIVTGSVDKTMGLSDHLRKAGFWVTPVRPPTVPPGGSRIRLSLNYAHKKDVLERFLREIQVYKRG